MIKNVVFAAPPICRTKEGCWCAPWPEWSWGWARWGSRWEESSRQPGSQTWSSPDITSCINTAEIYVHNRLPFLLLCILSFLGCPATAILSSCHVLAALSSLSCPRFHVTAIMSSCLELSVLFWLSSPSFPVSGSPALAVIFLLSCPLFSWRSALLLASDQLANYCHFLNKEDNCKYNVFSKKERYLTGKSVRSFKPL